MEQLRRAVRSALGYDSKAYRLASEAYIMAEVTRREGLATALELRRLETTPRMGVTELKLGALEHALLVRPGTPDIAAVINNIIREEYGQPILIREPLTLLDAGAYIGDTTAYFLSRFPNLRAVALEPDIRNFEIAARNLAPYGDRVQLIHAALDGERGHVRISGEHDGAGIAAQGDEVEALGVPDVLERVGWDQLDLLKMDIEGAEKSVLDCRADSWLERIKGVVLEPHGPAIEEVVRATLSRNGFQVTRYRSVLYASRQQVQQ